MCHVSVAKGLWKSARAIKGRVAKLARGCDFVVSFFLFFIIHSFSSSRNLTTGANNIGWTFSMFFQLKHCPNIQSSVQTTPSLRRVVTNWTGVWLTAGVLGSLNWHLEFHKSGFEQFLSNEQKQTLLQQTGAKCQLLLFHTARKRRKQGSRIGSQNPHSPLRKHFAAEHHCRSNVYGFTSIHLLFWTLVQKQCSVSLWERWKNPSLNRLANDQVADRSSTIQVWCVKLKHTVGQELRRDQSLTEFDT